VFGWKTRARNESESWDLCRGGHRRPDQTFCDGSAVERVCWDPKGEIVERETFEVSRVGRDSAQLPLGALLGRRVSINFDRRIKVGGMWHLSGCVIALDSHTAMGIEELRLVLPY